MAKVKYILLALLLCGSAFAEKEVDTVQGQDAQGCYDAMIWRGRPDSSYGGTDTLRIKNDSAHSLFWFSNVDTIGAGRIIDSMFLNTYVSSTIQNVVDSSAPTATHNGVDGWTNPDSLLTVNGKRAYGTWVDATLSVAVDNFDFAISADATIDSIQVLFEGLRVGTTDLDLYLSKDADGFTGPGAKWDRNLTTSPVGYNGHPVAAVLWGQTWTPAEINSNAFGVELRVLAGEAQVDYVLIKVFYHYATIYADLYELLKGPLTEGAQVGTTGANSPSWNDRNAPDSEWAKAGADSAAEGGLQNRADGYGPTAFTDADNVPTVVNPGFWTKGDSVLVSDNEYAHMDGAEEQTLTCMMTAYGFGFSLLAGDVIDSFKATYEGYVVTSEDARVYLTKDASNYTNTPGTAWSLVLHTHDSTFIGNPSALWGQTWTPAEVNNPLFGVVLWNGATSGIVYCDQVMLTVYYHSTGPDRAEDLMTQTAVPAATNRLNMEVDATLSQACYDGTKQGLWLMLKSALAGTGFTLSSSEHATTANRPMWIIYSRLPGDTLQGRRRAILIDE